MKQQFVMIACKDQRAMSLKVSCFLEGVTFYNCHYCFYNKITRFNCLESWLLLHKSQSPKLFLQTAMYKCINAGQ